MREIEEKLERYREIMEKADSLREDLEVLAESQGYEFDKEKRCLTKNKDEVYVMDIYIRNESAYEEFGYFSVYAGLIQMSEDYFNDIKNKFTKNKEDWEDILQSDYFFEDKNFENFRKGMFSLDYISKDMINTIWLAEDNVINTSREGFIEFFGEMYFGDDFTDGYISIFKMNKEIFEKNKHEEFFRNAKYLKDNAPFKYFKPDFNKD